MALVSSAIITHAAAASAADEATDVTAVPVTITSMDAELAIRFDRLDEPRTEHRCTTPCSLTVQPGRYHLHASRRGAREYGGTVHVGDSGASFAVEAGSKAGYTWGLVLTTFGAGSVAMWLGIYLPGYLSYPSDSYNQTMFTAMSIATVVTGVIPLASGILLMTSNGRGVRTEPAARPLPSVVPRANVGVGAGGAALSLRWTF